MLSGKVALITSASDGIGAATAIEFAKQDASLVLTDRNVPNLVATARKCFAISKNEVVIIPSGLTKDDNVKAIINTCIKSFNKLDILVNNGDIVDYRSITEAGVDELDKMYHTNVRPAYLLTQLSIPHLIITRGNVVNVSSVPSNLAYGVSKARFDDFNRSIAVELAKYKVRVNSVYAGFIKTDIRETSEEKIRDTFSLRRIGTADDVAKTILSLASDGSSFITGEIVCVGGGNNALCPL